MQVPRGLTHPRPLRPRPAVCSSAVTATTSVRASRTQRSASSCVDPTDCDWDAGEWFVGDIQDGVTDGSLLNGVKFEGDAVVTETVVMRSASGTVRWIKNRSRLK